MDNLRKEYSSICEEYVKAFEKKHELEFNYWIGEDRVGEIAVFGDYFLNFDDIRYDIDNNIEKEKILKWYDVSVDAGLSDKNFPNYRNWLKLKK